MLSLSLRAWCVGGLCVCCVIAPAAVRAQASPAAAANDAKALVEQLGDVDFKVREAATEKLKAMGREALPALKEAIKSANDPEICSRADAIVRGIERPRVPAEWLGADGLGGFGPTQVTSSIVNGVTRVNVSDVTGQRRVTIVEAPGGAIDMTVVGLENGRPVTAHFRASGADELREQDPDAYRVYQRWGGNRGAAIARRGRLIVPAPRAQFRVIPAPLPLPPPAIVRPPADDLTLLEEAVRRQFQEAKVPAEQQRMIEELLRRMQEIQAEGQAPARDEWDKQIQKYNALSDALREKLKDLKLADPGDKLPPPAKARLGVSVGVADPGVFGPGAEAGLTVHRVVSGSRAEQMGLKEGDVIRSVNGKAVADTGALRRAVSEANGPLVIEVTRGGKVEALKEKPAQP